MPKIAIIGATTWGLTLSLLLSRKRFKVRLLVRTPEEATKLRKSGPSRISGVTLPSDITITDSPPDALEETDAIILAVPAQTMRQNVRLLAPHLAPSMLVINAAKGLEIETGERMSQVIADEIDPAFHANICVLSGPNLAREILNDLPAASVVAAGDDAIAKRAQELLSAPNYCVYTNTDVIGVELGGALKNIIALGAGIMDGLRYGDNAKAAFVSRGLTEITALGVALGANPLTFSGLAGLGDLIATCASPLSRNHYVGVELVKGHSLDEIVKTMDGVAEGVATTRAAWTVAQKLGLEMPITGKIYQVLYNNVDPHQVAIELMGLQGRHELAGRRWGLFSLFRHRRWLR